ncbi:MAG: HlyD family secretion protein [Chlamydiales bacterium]|jgi:HlyD family secretion protein
MKSSGTVRRPRSSSRRGAGALAAVLGIGMVGAAALGWWYTNGRSSSDGSIDPGRLVTVETRDLLDAVSANGRVEPLARVAVMSRASGIVTALLVDEGDRVEKGQVLAELDREQMQAQVAQDEADVASAQARLSGAQARILEARVRLDDPEIGFLERESRRLDALLKTGDVSDRERDDAARALAVATFRLAQVQASLPVLEAAAGEARANLKSAEAALERSASTLSETTIRCPIDGVVLVRDREVGDGVSSILTAGGNATQLMILGDLSRMYIEARIDEVDLGRIHTEMKTVITVDAHRGRELVGYVDRIAPAGSVDNNGIVTFKVRIVVEDPDHLLRPDMTADTKLVLERRDGVPTLQQRAFRRGADGSWTVDRVVGSGESARLESIAVELGLSDGLMTEVTKGLASGDQVLLPDSGLQRGRGR